MVVLVLEIPVKTKAEAEQENDDELGGTPFSMQVFPAFAVDFAISSWLNFAEPVVLAA